MKKPTLAEVQAEVAKLKEMKPNVRRTSVFGDDHHDAIDAQIDVAEQNWDDEEIDNRLLPGDDDDSEFFPENVYNAANNMRLWLDGESTDKPSDEWKELLKK